MPLGADLREIRAPAMAFLAMGSFWGAWHALIPEAKAVVGASDAAFGSALLCVAAGAIPAMMLAGRMVGRLGPWLLPASIALFGAVAPLPALAGDPVSLGLALVLVGAASGFMDVVMNARVSEIESRKAASFMHLAHGLFSTAYLVAALATGIARSSGWGTAAVLGATATIMLVQAAGAVTHPLSSDRKAALQTPSGRSLGLPAILFGTIVFAAFLSENALQSWSALHLERSMAATPATGALGPAVIGLAAALGRFGGHIVTERIGEHRLIVMAALAAAIAVAGFGASAEIGPALAALFLAAAGISVLAPAAIGMAGRAVPPDARGAAVATASVVGYAGFFAGPALLGVLAERYGIAYAFGAVTLCLAAVVPLSAAARMRNNA